MSESVEIEIHGIKLTIIGDYYSGEKQERDYPGSYDSFDIEEIQHDNENIYDLVDPTDIEKIKDLVIEKLK